MQNLGTQSSNGGENPSPDKTSSSSGPHSSKKEATKFGADGIQYSQMINESKEADLTRAEFVDTQTQDSLRNFKRVEPADLKAAARKDSAASTEEANMSPDVNGY